VIVAHGQPSAPDAAEAALASLRGLVAARMPGWDIRSATLAAAGALKRALDGQPGAIVYPMFMADGWFTKTRLPQLLRAAGATPCRVLPPFGCGIRVHELAARIAQDAAAAAGVRPGDCDLVLAAHGSGRSKNAARDATRIAEAIGAQVQFHRIVLGFIEQTPRLADVARPSGRAMICLPLFAAGGAHVSDDIPAALDAAGFTGVRLGPIGLHRDVPELIATALREALHTGVRHAI